MAQKTFLTEYYADRQRYQRKRDGIVECPCVLACVRWKSGWVRKLKKRSFTCPTQQCFTLDAVM